MLWLFVDVIRSVADVRGLIDVISARARIDAVALVAVVVVIAVLVVIVVCYCCCCPCCYYYCSGRC